VKNSIYASIVVESCLRELRQSVRGQLRRCEILRNQLGLISAACRPFVALEHGLIHNTGRASERLDRSGTTSELLAAQMSYGGRMLERARTQINQIEEMANWVNDSDREWWPFLFLRPREHQRMGSRRVLALAVLYGFFAGMLANVVVVLTSTHRPTVSVFTFPLWTTFVFFVVYRTTFAYFWNRRATRLARAQAFRSSAAS
jgi:hypothetical protein